MAKDKAADFKRLADARLPKILDAIRIFGHLTNRQNYHCTPEDVAFYLGQIDAALDEVRAGFGPELCPPPKTGSTLIDQVSDEVFRQDATAENPTVRDPDADTDDWDANHRPATRYVEDPAHTLDDWKADPTTLGYRDWVAEQHRLGAEAVPDFLKKG